MKKLVLACCAIFAVGGCLMLGGWAAGGQLYGSYYNGALHPVSESIRDIAYGIQSQWQYHSWVDDHGWHSGWFDDHLDDWIDDTVDHAVDDALDSIDTDWVDDWLDTRHEAIARDIVIPRSIDTVSSLYFDFSNSINPEDTVQILCGADTFDVSGAIIQHSTVDNSTWTISLYPKTNEKCVIHVPSAVHYSDVSMNINEQKVDISGDSALIADKMDIQIGTGSLTADTLTCDDLNIVIGSGTLTADRIDTGTQGGNGKLNISLGEGNMTASVLSPFEDFTAFSYQVSSEGGMILLDGERIAGGSSGASHASQKGDYPNSPLLRAEVGSGTLDLMS